MRQNSMANFNDIQPLFRESSLVKDIDKDYNESAEEDGEESQAKDEKTHTLDEDILELDLRRVI